MIKKISTNDMGNKTLHCIGISTLVKDKEAVFLSDLEEIKIVDPAEVKLVPDNSPFFRRAPQAASANPDCRYRWPW